MDAKAVSHRVFKFQEIADRIENRITEGSLLPGERLPSERKLVAELQVSRSSVREAFRILVQKDLVEIRRGARGGAFVKPPSCKQALVPLSNRLHAVCEMPGFDHHSVGWLLTNSLYLQYPEAWLSLSNITELSPPSEKMCLSHPPLS
ncbi:MAG: winged helix-turn-helix domain-containing protein [Deltaproteobacteria bacterium]|nr:winged helix-turn-helix domain-containing protein [Deltaproteobacteria bacterium]